MVEILVIAEILKSGETFKTVKKAEDAESLQEVENAQTAQNMGIAESAAKSESLKIAETVLANKETKIACQNTKREVGKTSERKNIQTLRCSLCRILKIALKRLGREHSQTAEH